MQNISSQSSMSPLIRELVFGSYFKAEKFLHGLDAKTRDISLAAELLQQCNVTFDQWPRVTVTGSKGKGSTAVFLSSILSASGEKVGLITSPHLRKFNERIRIDGQSISDQELEEIAEEIAPVVRAFVKKIKPPKYLGSGAVILLLAAKFFQKHKITALVVEAGRGGEYDESRLVKANVSVITPVMLKHTANLGATVEEIARTKTYITAPESTIISSPQTATVMHVIQDVAKDLSSPVMIVGKDANVLHTEIFGDKTICDIAVGEQVYEKLSLSLIGSYQTENAATAILAALELKKIGAKFTREGIYKGVSQVTWPGRCQLLQKDPWVLLDGVINKTTAQYLSRILEKLPANKITAVVAIHRASDLEGVCSVITKFVDELILTEVHSTSLAWDKKSLLETGAKYFKNISYIADVDDAFTYVRNNIAKNEGVLLLGHQSFVGAAADFWAIDTSKLW